MTENNYIITRKGTLSDKVWKVRDSVCVNVEVRSDGCRPSVSYHL